MKMLDGYVKSTEKRNGDMGRRCTVSEGCVEGVKSVCALLRPRPLLRRQEKGETTKASAGGTPRVSHATAMVRLLWLGTLGIVPSLQTFDWTWCRPRRREGMPGTPSGGILHLARAHGRLVDAVRAVGDSTRRVLEAIGLRTLGGARRSARLRKRFLAKSDAKMVRKGTGHERRGRRGAPR